MSLGDLLRQYEDIADREPHTSRLDLEAERAGSILDRYDRDDWARRFRPREPERNVRVIALGDALADADVTGARAGAPKPLRELSGGVRSSILQASRQFYSDVPMGDRIEAGTEEVARGLDACESPIEKHILPWLVFGNWGYERRRAPTPVVDSFDNAARRFIMCQVPIQRYRIDFLVVYRTADDQSRMVALECDGADFHDPAKDAVRDRSLLARGILTIRASGKEIYDRPWRVVARVDEAFYKLGGY